jgi:hypothetical protein
MNQPLQSSSAGKPELDLGEENMDSEDEEGATTEGGLARLGLPGELGSRRGEDRR